MKPQSSTQNHETQKIDVRYVAHLARLELSPEEIEKFSRQLGDILSHVEQLKKVEVEGVEPTSFAASLANGLRADEVKPSLPQSEALQNAPKKANNLFIVPKVVE